ncbi:trypco2 family protein [Streptomyces sp. NPDC051310]|uniref:trypco2 family protein n=1 Tax=Streptomyces sp. NPDC051310 TaxID=3365649 RepID=UPI0037A12A80
MNIELGDAVTALRDSLMEAALRGEGRDITFDVGPIELEFNVEIRQEARGKASFRAWVVTADAEGSAARSRSHRVLVTLTPRRGGGPVQISADGRGSAAGGEAPDDRVRARRPR